MSLDKINLSGVGVVHFGLGAFFRAFGLPQLQEMKRKLSSKDIPGWDVIGVSFRSAGVRDCLSLNGYRYHAVELAAETYNLEEINILRSVYFLQEQREDIMHALVSPELKMVTLTITEKGYYYDAYNESIDWNHSQIQQDLNSPEKPNSPPGLLVLALRNRRKIGLPPFACVSCDNLVENGSVLKKVILDLAHRMDPNLADWINKNTAFPCTMVDRIVPAPTSKEIERISQLTDWKDPAPVLHEPFRQWIIEDCFESLPRPPLEHAGVVFTNDVKPFEEMKLRLLNATHSAIAYIGQMLEKKTVFEAVQDQQIADFINNLWELELCPSLEQPPDINLAQYTRQLMLRYKNPSLFHETLQIAMDGSQKIPQRILSPIRSNLIANRSIRSLSLVVAVWIMFLIKKDSAGKIQEINDPMRAPLLEAIRKNNPVDNILGISEIFSKDLILDERFRKSVTQSFKLISQLGLRACLKQ